MKEERDPRFRHLEWIVGTFVIVALVGLIAVIAYIGIETDRFGETYHLRLRRDSGAGFSPGMAVQLSGFRIGRIQKISLDDQAKAVVRIRIRRTYSKWIRTDSVATLHKEGLVGDNILSISVGSPDRPMLTEDEFIRFREEKGLNEMAFELSDSVRSVLSEVRRTVAYINDPKGDIKQALANIGRLSANLEETRRSADVLLLTAEDNLGRIGPVLDNATAVIDNVAVLLGNAGRSLPVLLERVEGTLTHAEGLSRELRRTAEQSGPRVSPLLRSSEELVEDTDEVIKGIKRMWPIRKHIPPPIERGIVPGDSYE